MKIAILGTRGIPNYYGGFEQFAEFFSVFIAKKGHEVCVYNSHNHRYQEKTFKGVNIIHQFDPEYKLGTFGQFIYPIRSVKSLINSDDIYESDDEKQKFSSSKMKFLNKTKTTICATF